MVLPPVPDAARVSGYHPAVGAVAVRLSGSGDSDEHTVISQPPSPELLASMAVAPRAPAAAPLALPQASGSIGRRGGVRLSYSQLGLMLLVALVAGGGLTEYLRPMLRPTAAGQYGVQFGHTALIAAPAAAVAPERAPVVPCGRASGSASGSDATRHAAHAGRGRRPRRCTAAAKAAVAKVPAGRARAARASSARAVGDATAARPARPGKVAAGKRPGRAKRAVKKPFVDPFE